MRYRIQGQPKHINNSSFRTLGSIRLFSILPSSNRGPSRLSSTAILNSPFRSYPLLLSFDFFRSYPRSSHSNVGSIPRTENARVTCMSSCKLDSGLPATKQRKISTQILTRILFPSSSRAPAGAILYVTTYSIRAI